ncbi:hypothetical protein TNCV_4281911 [Trichonephila clavipes]|nr:hypothetical protein TNCV_4281911 [Trichonephila clavipes]
MERTSDALPALQCPRNDHYDSGGLMVSAGITLDDHTHLYVFARRTVTTVIYSSCGSSVVKVSDHGKHVMSSSPVPLLTHRVGQRCTLNLSRAKTWAVRRGGS